MQMPHTHKCIYHTFNCEHNVGEFKKSPIPQGEYWGFCKGMLRFDLNEENFFTIPFTLILLLLRSSRI